MNSDFKGSLILRLLDELDSSPLIEVEDLYQSAYERRLRDSKEAIAACERALRKLSKPSRVHSDPMGLSMTKGKTCLLLASIHLDLNQEKDIKIAEEYYKLSQEEFYRWQWKHLESLAYLGIAITQKKSKKSENAMHAIAKAQDILNDPSVPSIDTSNLRRAISDEQEAIYEISINKSVVEDSSPTGIDISDISGGDTDIGNVISGEVRGDVIGRDKIGGDQIRRDKFVADTIIINYPPPPVSEVTTPDTPLTDKHIPDNPYRGLFAFRPEHAHLFFGRESFIEQLVQSVERRPFTAVLGASGSGKSSVVFAGLVPRLLNHTDNRWIFTTFRPGDDPFLGLANALIPLLEPNLGTVKQIGEARDLSSRLRKGQVPLTDYLNHIQERQPDHRLLIIADQFEEFYTLYPDLTARQQFLEMLLNTFRGVQGSFPRLVLTLRADFLDQALAYRPFADALRDSDIKLGPMNAEELRMVIEKPAEIQKVTFEAGLVDRILKDVSNQPGNLPLLEFALTALWKEQTSNKLTHDAYDAIGRVEGALSRHAEQVFKRLDRTEQDQVQRVLVQMVRPGEETEDTRRLATKAEIGKESWGLIQQLANERLVVTNQGLDGNETVEMVHEALIQNWERLAGWMGTARQFRIWQEQLRFSLNLWSASQKDKGALLRGTLLTKAEVWLVERETELSQNEREYIQESLALRKREQVARLFQWGTPVFIAVVLILVIFWGSSFWQNGFDPSNIGAVEITPNMTQAPLPTAVPTESALVPVAIVTDTPTPIPSDTPTLLPRPTPRPATVVFVQSNFNTHELGLITSSGESLTDLLHPRAAAPAWSPDGQRIAFFGEEGIGQLGGIYAQGTGIWILTPQTGEAELLFQFDHIRNIAWSPDGSRLAFEYGPPDVTHETYIIDAIEGREITRFPGEQPAWSPDGQELVIKTCSPECGLWKVRFDGKGGSLITKDSTDSYPTWSPNNDYLVFSSRVQEADWEIYRLDLETDEIERLTNHPGTDTTPTFSPDGLEVYYRSDTTGQWQIRVMAIDGTNDRVIRDNVGTSDDWGLARPAVR